MKKTNPQYRFGRFWFDATQRDLQLDGMPLPARTQALGLLAALLEKPGALLSKDELMKAAWPNSHVEEANISVQVHYLRQILQDSAKPHRWIATVPGRGYRFIGQLEPPPSSDSGLPSRLPSSDTELPAVLSPMIGRERELAALQAHMPRHRLVTVTGSGGMGKTRLAVDFAREHGADPLNKILFLGLESLRQKDQITFRLATSLGMQPTEGPLLTKAIAEALQKLNCFLVLDNCEHVLDEVAAFVKTILEQAPSVSILATSREPLKIEAELVFPLGPLYFPAAAATLSTREIARYPAVQLFAENALASNPAFALTDETAGDVAAICRKMEGIPLALQLAAARLHALSLQELLTGIFVPRCLSTALVDVPARHQTVEATIAWSVALLSTEEQSALRRLSIFPSSFTIEGATAVVPDNMFDGSKVVDLLNSLCDKSLLVRSLSTHTTGRFRLLESTRDYAVAMLAEVGETRELNLRLASYMVGLFGRSREAWANANAEIWCSDFGHDIESLRAALDWAFCPSGSAAIGIALAARMRALFSDRLITQREFLSAIALAVASLDLATSALDKGWVLLSGSYDLATGGANCATLAIKAVTSFRVLADSTLVGLAAARAAVLLAMHAGQEQPNAYLEQAIAQLPLVPTNRYRSAILINVATCFAVISGSESSKAALGYFAEALPIAQAFNDRAQISLIYANLAELEAKLGNYDKAIGRVVALAQRSRASHDWRRLSHDLLNLTNYNLLANRVQDAEDAAREAIPLLIDFQDEHWGADYGGSFAMLAARTGKWQIAAKLAGYSEHFFSSPKKLRAIVDRRLWNQLTTAFENAAVSRILQDSDRFNLMAEGSTLSFREALDISRILGAERT